MRRIKDGGVVEIVDNVGVAGMGMGVVGASRLCRN